MRLLSPRVSSNPIQSTQRSLKCMICGQVSNLQSCFVTSQISVSATLSTREKLIKICSRSLLNTIHPSLWWIRQPAQLISLSILTDGLRVVWFQEDWLEVSQGSLCTSSVESGLFSNHPLSTLLARHDVNINSQSPKSSLQRWRFWPAISQWMG